jgi:TonB-linked SusC/RagA family outer membrane protein
MTYIKKIIISTLLLLNYYLVFSQDTTNISATSVSGFVFDAETNDPIPFASVNNGDFSSTFTEADGSFTIKIKSSKDILSVSAPGFVEKDLVLASMTKIEIYLISHENFSYQKVANFGYNTNKLAYTTQSVASVSLAENADKKAATTAESSFEGKIAGLNIIKRNGIPGSGSELFLRGFSSLNATNSPLFIVDGMIFDTEVYGNPLITGFRPNPLNDIDVNDIENITVVKDASALYGAKAANGVIFIRTKRPVEQATKIEMRTYGGITLSPNTIPVMDADNYRLYLNDILSTSNFTSSKISNYDPIFNDNINPDYYRYHNNTYWQKEIFSNSYNSNYNLSIQGGDDIILLYASVGYLKHNGNIKNTDYSRFNLRINGDISISKLFSVNASFSFIHNKRNLLAGSALFDTDDPLYSSQVKAPFTYPYIRDESGIITPNLEDFDIFNVSNPLALINNMEKTSLNFRIFGSFDFHLKLNKNLTISNLIGRSYDKNRENIFVPKEGVVPVELELGVGENRLANRALQHNVYYNDFRVKYSKNFGNHNADLLGGMRLNYNKNNEDWIKDYNSANDDLTTVGNGILLFNSKGGIMGNWTDLAYYLSAEYNYQKKYFLTLNVSANGSSRFGEEVDALTMFGAKFGVFPSVSAAWLVSSEPFFKNISFVEFLKIRASYGITGNDDIGNYASRKAYSSDKFLGHSGLIIGSLWNPKLKWETNTKMNFGADISLVKERFSISVDYFINKTEDMLFFRPIDPVSGFSYFTENNGSFTTKGIDLMINTRVINKPFKWDIGITFSKYKTNVISVYGDKYISNILGANVLTETGKPLGVFYGYKTDGVFATRQEAENAGLKIQLPNLTKVPFNAGDVIFVDSKPDSIINSDDMQVIGDPNPDFFGEFNTRLKWKAVSLDAAVSFSYGNDVFNYLRYKLESMSDLSNQTPAAMNRWRYDGQVTEMPRAAYGDPMGNSRFSDRWIEDGSFVRLRNLTVSYKLPLKYNILQSAEVYVTAINLVTLTKYKGLDPEFSYSGFSLARGIDPGLVPQSKAFLAGFKIGL